MTFPSRRLRLKHPPAGLEEPLKAAAPPRARTSQRIVLRLAHATHYLQHVRPGPAAFGAVSKAYLPNAYDALRALPLPGAGKRSLFRPDGIVPGTERRERWILWLTGVPEPGAMRQWGHHAVAFIGRRHFDDAPWLERYFAPRRPERHGPPMESGIKR